MFVRVCAVSEIGDGELLKFDVRGRSIMVTRVGEVFFASDATCTHEEADLSLGSFFDYVITCPLHQAKFDIRNGLVLEGPNGADPNSIPALLAYKTKIEKGELLVELGE